MISRGLKQQKWPMENLSHKYKNLYYSALYADAADADGAIQPIEIFIKQYFFKELSTIKDYYLNYWYEMKNGNKSCRISCNLSFILCSITT